MDNATLATVLRDIAAGKITRKAAAKRLGGVSERQVNRLMKLHGVRRPPSKGHEERELSRALAEEGRRMKTDNADAVVAGNQSLEEAAVNAGCSTRTMYRWVSRAEKSRVSNEKRPKNTTNARKKRRKRTK